MIEWTTELVDRLCDEIASGRGIAEVSREDWCPSEPSIYRRMAKDADFAERVRTAREAQQDAEVERCVEMADKATAEDWQVVRLRIWARQWRAAKLRPQVYGDKVQTQHLGKDGQPTDPPSAIDLAAALAGWTPKGE